jgi:hypothetical protein
LACAHSALAKDFRSLERTGVSAKQTRAMTLSNPIKRGKWVRRLSLSCQQIVREGGSLAPGVS